MDIHTKLRRFPGFGGTNLSMCTPEEMGKLIYRADQWLRENVPSDENLTSWFTYAVPDSDDEEDCINNATGPIFVMDCLFEFLKTVVTMNDEEGEESQ